MDQRYQELRTNVMRDLKIWEWEGSLGEKELEYLGNLTRVCVWAHLVRFGLEAGLLSQLHRSMLTELEHIIGSTFTTISDLDNYRPGWELKLTQWVSTANLTIEL